MEYERVLFGAADYAIFALVLVISACIGLYYALAAGKQKTTSEFLMADRSMGFFPVSMSLLASLFTGIFIQGVTADIYFRGTMSVWLVIGQLGASWIAGRCFLPVYYRLRLTSLYEYLELRFNPAVRTCGLVICYAYMILHSGIATFGASMVIIAVSDLNLASGILILSFVAMFYTTIGGLKAVLWADCFQMFLIFTSLVAVIIKGSVNQGGMSNIIAKAKEGDRIEFGNVSLDPKEYMTIWNLLAGIISWLPSQAIMQYQVQRYLTCKDLKTANVAMSLYASGMVLVTALCCLAGLAMYGSYAGCDPFTQGSLQFRDGILPYFILDAFQHLPGVSGLLTAGLCSLCLSTVSSVLNALSAVTGQHFVMAYWPNLTDSVVVLINKFLIIFFGAIVIGSSFLMTMLGDLIPALFGIIGITNGPMLGVFMLGIFTFKATSKGVLCGFFTSFAFGLWLLLGSLKHPYPLKILPLSVEECPLMDMANSSTDTMTTMVTTMFSTVVQNVTLSTTIDIPRSTLQNFYALAKPWYPIVTCAISIVVGYAVSLATGPNDPDKVDPRLVCYVPDACCFFLPHKLKFWKRDHELQEIPPLKRGIDTAVPLTEDYEDHNKENKQPKTEFSDHDDADSKVDDRNHNM